MCCIVRVMREDGKPFPLKVLGPRLLRRYTRIRASPTRWDVSFDARGDCGVAHLVKPHNLMRALKEAIGFANRCREKGVICQVVQAADPCDEHVSHYPYPLSDFCLMAMAKSEESE